VDHELVARLQEVARHERAHDPQPHETHCLLHLSTLLFGKTYSFEEVIYIVERPREALGPFLHCVVYEGWSALGASMSRFEIKAGCCLMRAVSSRIRGSHVRVDGSTDFPSSVLLALELGNFILGLSLLLALIHPQGRRRGIRGSCG
jgi:hypothetical protein